MTPALQRLVADVLATNTRDYWLDICARTVALCDAEERWCRQHGKPVPKWVAARRREYIDLDETLLCERTQP